MAEHSYYPPLTVVSHTDRFYLQYPRDLKGVESYHKAITQDEVATKYLGARRKLDMTLPEALKLSQKNASDKHRMQFEIYLPNTEAPSQYDWIGYVGLVRMEFSDIEAQVPEAQKPRGNVGEIGVFLSSASHRKMILTEAMITVLDIAFSSSDNELSNTSGFGLDKVFTRTDSRNLPMRGFMENTLGLVDLEPGSGELSETLRATMAQEDSDKNRSVVYCLRRQNWLDGKREELITKVESKFGGKANLVNETGSKAS